MGKAFLMTCSQQVHHHHLHTFCRLVHFQIFLYQRQNITFKRFVLSVVKGQHLQLKYHPLLFCNFKLSNIRVTIAHHPVIQKELDDQLAKGATVPSTCGSGFYSHVFVVLMGTGGL